MMGRNHGVTALKSAKEGNNCLDFWLITSFSKADMAILWRHFVWINTSTIFSPCGRYGSVKKTHIVERLWLCDLADRQCIGIKCELFGGGSIFFFLKKSLKQLYFLFFFVFTAEKHMHKHTEEKIWSQLFFHVTAYPSCSKCPPVLQAPWLLTETPERGNIIKNTFCSRYCVFLH